MEWLIKKRVLDRSLKMTEWKLAFHAHSFEAGRPKWDKLSKNGPTLWLKLKTKIEVSKSYFQSLEILSQLLDTGKNNGPQYENDKISLSQCIFARVWLRFLLLHWR